MSICVLGGGWIAKNIQDYFGRDRVRVVPHSELDLTNFQDLDHFFRNNLNFEYVILTATVGGTRLKPDPEDTVEQNVRMYLNVSQFACYFKKFIWFSSGASFNSNSRYGFSKLIQEKLWSRESLYNSYCLRIYGCFGPTELPTRFLSTCVREGHVTIDNDRYFDFIHINDVCRVIEIILNYRDDRKSQLIDLVYPEKYKLSELASMLGVECTIKDTSDENYISMNRSLGTYIRFEPMCDILKRFKKEINDKLNEGH